MEDHGGEPERWYIRIASHQRQTRAPSSRGLWLCRSILRSCDPVWPGLSSGDLSAARLPLVHALSPPRPDSATRGPTSTTSLMTTIGFPSPSSGSLILASCAAPMARSTACLSPLVLMACRSRAVRPQRFIGEQRGPIYRKTSHVSSSPSLWSREHNAVIRGRLAGTSLPTRPAVGHPPRTWSFPSSAWGV